MKITSLSPCLGTALPLTACLFFILPFYAVAQKPSYSFTTPYPYKTETEWPGIDFRIVDVERIMQNRLMVVVRIEATKEAPAKGTLIGHPPVIPAYVIKEEDRRRYGFTPFFLTGSSMTDELSAVAYPMLPPIAPRGHGYLPSGCMATLRPGDTEMLSLQFAVPPPPPPPEPGVKPIPQTLSFLFPKAKGLILHVPLPPVGAAGAASP